MIQVPPLALPLAVTVVFVEMRVKTRESVPRTMTLKLMAEMVLMAKIVFITKMVLITMLTALKLEILPIF